MAFITRENKGGEKRGRKEVVNKKQRDPHESNYYEELEKENIRLKILLAARVENFNISGFHTGEEFLAYEKGYDIGQELCYRFTENWDGSTNSAFGQALHDAMERVIKKRETVVCGNCNESVVMVSEGEICPKCFC